MRQASSQNCNVYKSVKREAFQKMFPCQSKSKGLTSEMKGKTTINVRIVILLLCKIIIIFVSLLINLLNKIVFLLIIIIY